MSAQPTFAGDTPAGSRTRGIRVGYRTPRGPLWAVDGVDLEVAPGESVGPVGGSGCGRSSLGRGLVQLPPSGAGVRGSVELAGEELVGASQGVFRRKRGDDVVLVFQEPMIRLDPLMKVSAHFIEAVRAHRPDVSKDETHHMARAALAQMGIPPTRVDDYPHEFSGGMRQRIMIALAIVLRPKLIIADEPTTALDVIVESQILDILDRLRRDERVGLFLNTHNLGIVAGICDRIAVMYAGRIVDVGPVEEIFRNPKHPYTQGLLASTISLETTELHTIEGYPPDLIDPPSGCRFNPRCPARTDHCPDIDPVLTLVGPGQSAACLLYPGADGSLLYEDTTRGGASHDRLPPDERRHDRPGPGRGRPDRRPGARAAAGGARPRYPLPGTRGPAAPWRADGRPCGRRGLVRRPSRRGVRPGRRIRLGQGPLGRSLLKLVQPTAGSVRYRGRDLGPLSARQMRPLRRELAFIFQDPNASLNPAMTVRQGVGHPLRIHAWPRRGGSRASRWPRCSNGSDSTPARRSSTSTPRTSRAARSSAW